MPFSIESMISAVGYPGLFFMVFAETGLLVGFFLPGDTLLITTGLLVQRGHLSLAGHSGILFIIPLLIAAAVIGDGVGYQIGVHGGRRLYQREDSRFFKRRHLDRARAFYQRHGGKTIILARFLAVIRTFAPTVAGAAGMPYRKFLFYNVIGGALWVASLILIGYFVGTAIPNVDVFFAAIIAITVGLSAAPAGWHLLRERWEAKRA